MALEGGLFLRINQNLRHFAEVVREQAYRQSLLFGRILELRVFQAILNELAFKEPGRLAEAKLPFLDNAALADGRFACLAQVQLLASALAKLVIERAFLGINI